MRRQMQSLFARYKQQRILVAYHELQVSDPERLAGVVEAAVRACQKSDRGSRVVTLILGMGPDAAWGWFGLDAERRSALERDLGVVLTMRPLKRSAVRQKLEHADVVHSDQDVTRVLAASGGWPSLVERLIEQQKHGMNIGVACEDLVAAIRQTDSDVAREFRGAFGLETHGPQAAAMGELLSLLPADEDGLSEVLADVGDMDAAECRRLLYFLGGMGCLEYADDGQLRANEAVAKVLGH